jgi:uncharacterized membrane protein YphA (DoxX/SURF4 family)
MKRVLVLIARLVVGGLFIYAGALKAADPGGLIRDIWNFQLVPEPWAWWLAAYLPFLEVLAGIALITGLQRRGAHLLLGGLLVAFLAALIVAAARGLDVNCGCFGSNPDGTSSSLTWPIIRDLLLLTGLAVSIWAARRETPAAPAGAS